MIQPWLVWELARKDLLLFAADRRGMLLCFAVPIVLATAFGAIFHQPEGSEPRKPRVWVVAQDDAPFARRVSEALQQSEKMQASQCDLATAQRRLASEASGVVIVLPAGWRSSADAPHVEFLHHPLGEIEARYAEGLFAEAVLREAARDILGPYASGLKAPFTVDRQAVPGGGALSCHAYSHSFCGMTLQYLLFWGMDSGLMLLRERRQGTWRRLRAAPLSRADILAGRALATVLIALLMIALTFGFGAVFCGVRITGSAIGFALMAFSAALLSAAAGLVVAALGGNEGRARTVSILAILTLSLLGGLWLPSFLLPGWAQTIALALPTTWAARGLEGVCWQGMGLSEAWPCAAILTAFSVAFLAFAWWRLVQDDGPVAGEAE
jgi:ABC-2 type transport system permease protein